MGVISRHRGQGNPAKKGPQLDRYTPPQVRDYGTLLELTADLDVNLVGVTTNLVLAAMSGPSGGGPGGPGGTPDNTVLTPGPGGGGGSTITPDGPTGNGGGATPGGVNEVADRDASGGGSGGGGAGGGGAGGGVGSAAGGEQKKLPFTGFPVMLAAGVGAALTSGGVLLRSRLRRRPGGSD